ncbi:bifunctional diaminohydroxyphosphoribosylaminopyrimidine deaminase/5-amino-6-(5-phosphoribosylamino)uracil reductase RibD [Vibrio sp. S17_S38]|uniref:bifunctional diaminohydroxyphosphoribosylaminopyrimidine deaminase/5-amino-6-(5-phosphoribosylamino)uracil reductase RibD n=1 Tax=Vibrio sp. S17_S38 TaxID=2720229 RepID=UPI001680B708|nr:bifunctional diaminohydroxyphosphoribosylaminopyrimidine deaminase/5-amino-6-(5-phosphoribosylamino)uracil reductase RibD [Vibrio sp. S17_S38]MBD1572355.1 bifunctional diaminohydroxyphosphoribosylaminopyrimidine deaminase/5-amino-6-(5-phosphoribosylamino)uracil reductase RibD [Vibrio sp. S17_S38]
MSFSNFDHQMMSRALQLAKKGIYTTAPNPNVGCVITLGESIVGEGAHLKAGEPHAEVHALRQAVDNAKGATAYVTLEPCSHFGRTPPCAAALIQAQVSRVVCAMQDPNPQVSGRGIQMLRDAGIKVDVGLLEGDAIALNPGFIKRMKTGMPFVQLKLAASLDGKTALKNGESKWITGSKARQDVQVFRAKAGAILSSSKTVLDDNASLNVRWNDLPESVALSYAEPTVRQPIRIILDRNNSINKVDVNTLNLLKSDGDLLLVVGQKSDTKIVSSPKSKIESIQAPLNPHHQFDLSLLLKQLANEHNINHIWVEAGATLATSFIEQGLVDELIVYLSPKLMGTDGRGLTQITGLESMQDTIDLTVKDCRMVGDDIRLIATLNSTSK